MDRREFLKRSALVGAGLTLSSLARIPSGRAVGGCRWGAYAKPRPGQSGKSAITDLEALIGRQLAITRHYLDWNAALPGNFIDWSARRGHIPYVSWHATPLTWQSIASGTQDDWIRTQAKSLKAAGYPIYFGFHHEPENDTTAGAAADFRSAFNHVRNVFDRIGVTNLTWVVALMASTYDGGHGGPEPWLPNPANYDMLAVDGYNRFPCLPNRSKHHWKPFSELFATAHAAAVAKGKPLFVGEYGCVEQNACGYASGDPLAKAQWFRDAGTTIKSWPEVKAVVYSHTKATYQGFNEAFWVDTSTASLSAFREVGADPYFS